MSWRILVISSRSKIDFKLNHIVIRNSESVTKVHINEISTLIIENNAISITGIVLSELIKNKVKIIFCDETRSPISELVPYYGSHDSCGKIREQIKWKKETKELLWTRIVKEKIYQQSQVLKYKKMSQVELLRKYYEEVETNDSSNREGHAAKVYFNALFGNGFNRGLDCNINSALNYGYSIILSAFNREIVKSGYLTQLGIFHDNMFNFFNLSCDLMEPFRPLVDYTVINMNLDEFTTDHKEELVNILNRKVIIDGKKHFLNNAIQIYTRSFFESLEENNISLLKFFNYEL